MEELVSVLFVSANVGSLFEDPENLLQPWMKEFFSVLNHYGPKFLALHCQEVGGKELSWKSMQAVEEFLQILLASDSFSQYGRILMIIDEDGNSNEHYTALGNFYFLHDSLQNVQIWDFNEKVYKSLSGRVIHKGIVDEIGLKEKIKFPLEFFPDAKWSRKGYMRTRWRIGCTVFDLVNVHMFHDACNFVAAESCPSMYSKKRQKGIEYILKRMNKSSCEKAPFFIFGDFNFRLDLKSVVQKLTETASPVYVKSAKNGEVEKIVYKNPKENDKIVLTLGKKYFDLEHFEETFPGNSKWLQEYDLEPKIFQGELFEFDVSFPPSYPFTEDDCGTSYMRTRIPSWCDRILLSQSALSLINTKSLSPGFPPVIYKLVGEDVPMGDHKPVMLSCSLQCFTGKSNSANQLGP